MSEYGEPWHRVRERVYNGPGGEVTHVAVAHDPGETGPGNGTVVPESPDDARLARAVACVDLPAGVPDDVLAGEGIDGTLHGLLRAVLRNPEDWWARGALADRPNELTDDCRDAVGAYPETVVISTADRVASATPGRGTPSPGGST